MTVDGLAVAVLVGEVLGRGLGDGPGLFGVGVGDGGVILGIVLEGNELAEGVEVDEGREVVLAVGAHGGGGVVAILGRDAGHLAGGQDDVEDLLLGRVALGGEREHGGVIAGDVDGVDLEAS